MSHIKFCEDYCLEPFGLQNTGVICYFNSMLQCFLSCTSVVETFVCDPELQTRNALCTAVYRLIEGARAGSDVSNMSPTIWNEFMKRLKPKHRFGRGQEDTNEGFLLFLDALGAPEIERIFEHRYRHVILCTKCDTKHQVVGDEGVFIEFSRDEIKQYGGDIQAMVIRQTPEIDDAYRCKSCNMTGEKRKVTRLTMAPEVLIVLLKKYNGKWTVDAPETMEIPRGNGEYLKYRLVALNEHSGTANGGHYWANAVRSGGRVWNLNDTGVSAGTLKSGTTTYMLWYHVI